MHRIARSLTIAALVAFLPVAAAEPPDCAGWCVDLVDVASGQSLQAVRADYEVDVYGAVAFGTLRSEFRNDAAGEVTAELRVRTPAGLETRDVRFERGGETAPTPGEKDAPPRARGAVARQAPPAATLRATIAAGETVEVASAFRLQLAVEKGQLALRLPALGRAGNEEREADDSLPHGYAIQVHHDEPLAVVESPSHEIFVNFAGDHSSIELAAGETYRGGPFVLHFTIGSEDDPTLVSHAGREREGLREVTAVLTPPSKPRKGTSRPKQLLFVLDTSGSMGRDRKLDEARTALFSALERVTGADTFNVVEFDGEFSVMADLPLPGTAENVATAHAWLGKQRPGGATLLLPALAAAIDQPEDPDRHEMIVLMTDGNVQDPRQVEQLLQQKLGQGRLFVVGIGGDMKQENIQRFAEFGRGTAVFADTPGGLDASLSGLFDAIGEPLIWDIEIDWGGVEVQDMQPSRVPDLYAGRPVTVRARVRGELPERLRVRGATMEGERTFTTPIARE